MQYRISDTLLIETNLVLSEEDVAAIAADDEAGTFQPQKWNVQAIEHVEAPPVETVTIPVAEYTALQEAAQAASAAQATAASTASATRSAEDATLTQVGVDAAVLDPASTVAPVGPPTTTTPPVVTAPATAQ